MTTPASERARALVAAATPGPWRAVPYGNSVLDTPIDYAEGAAQFGWQVDAPSDEVCDTGYDHPFAEPDAALIAAAPALLLELADEVERLAALAADCEADHPPEPWAAKLQAERDAALAEAARLREALRLHGRHSDARGDDGSVLEPACDVWRQKPCSCGYSAALEGATDG
jgi:hypothetical protein